MPTAANADDGELTEVEDVEMLGEIVHLCLQHRIQGEITNSSLTKIPPILYRLLTGTYVHGESTTSNMLIFPDG